MQKYAQDLLCRLNNNCVSKSEHPLFKILEVFRHKQISAKKKHTQKKWPQIKISKTSAKMSKK